MFKLFTTAEDLVELSEVETLKGQNVVPVLKPTSDHQFTLTKMCESTVIYNTRNKCFYEDHHNELEPGETRIKAVIA